MTSHRVDNTKKDFFLTEHPKQSGAARLPLPSRLYMTPALLLCCSNEAGSAARAALLFVSDGKTLAESEPGVWRAAGEISLSVTALSREKWHITSPR